MGKITVRINNFLYEKGSRIGAIQDGKFVMGGVKGVTVLISDRFDLEELEEGKYYSLTAEIDVFQTKKKLHNGNFAKLGLVKKVSNIVKYNDIDIVKWNNGMGSRERRASLLLFSKEHVVRFTGESIPGICVILGTDFNKNGKWSSTTYTIALLNGYKFSAIREHFENGTYIWKYGSIAEMSECIGLEDVPEDIVLDFISAQFPNTYAKYQEVVRARNVMGDVYEISWNNQIGSRERRSTLLFYKDDKIVEFVGDSIEGVCHILSKDLKKDGKWSSTTYRLMVNDEYRNSPITQDFENGVYVTKTETIQQMAESLGLSGVSESVVAEFVKLRFSGAWKKYEAITEGMRSLGGNTKMISYNDGIASRSRKPMLLFVKEDSIVKFDGTSDVAGVYTITNSDYVKNGKWSSTSYEIKYSSEYEAKELRQSFDGGRFIDDVSSLGVMKTQLKCDIVDDVVFVEFLKKNLFKALERHEEVKASLSGTDGWKKYTYDNERITRKEGRRRLILDGKVWDEENIEGVIVVVDEASYSGMGGGGIKYTVMVAPTVDVKFLSDRELEERKGNDDNLAENGDDNTGSSGMATNSLGDFFKDIVI